MWVMLEGTFGRASAPSGGGARGDGAPLLPIEPRSGGVGLAPLGGKAGGFFLGGTEGGGPFLGVRGAGSSAPLSPLSKPVDTSPLSLLEGAVPPEKE